MLNIQKFNKIITANWKLNGSYSFSRDYFNNLKINESIFRDNCLIICPPFPYIGDIKSQFLFKGAQDCSEYNQGAYTGEVSATILKDIGCNFCIVGHSERRNLMNDTNGKILKKINNCINAEIIPILCIGETFNQKKENLTEEILKDQIKKCLPKNVNLNALIIAYEPIWSIGTGMTPNLKDISKIHKYIKNSIFSDSKLKILYGGSVKANNYKEILNLPDVDGLLVGGASINLNEFNKIIKF